MNKKEKEFQIDNEVPKASYDEFQTFIYPSAPAQTYAPPPPPQSTLRSLGNEIGSVLNSGAQSLHKSYYGTNEPVPNPSRKSTSQFEDTLNCLSRDLNQQTQPTSIQQRPYACPNQNCKQKCMGHPNATLKCPYCQIVFVTPPLPVQQPQHAPLQQPAMIKSNCPKEGCFMEVLVYPNVTMQCSQCKTAFTTFVPTNGDPAFSCIEPASNNNNNNNNSNSENIKSICPKIGCFAELLVSPNTIMQCPYCQTPFIAPETKIDRKDGSVVALEIPRPNKTPLMARRNTSS